MSIGDNIKRKRNELNLTQEQLGEQSGVSKTSIYMFEKGTKIPSVYTSRTIAETLNCTVEELLK